jgi:hypothetical protein
VAFGFEAVMYTVMYDTWQAVGVTLRTVEATGELTIEVTIELPTDSVSVTLTTLRESVDDTVVETVLSDEVLSLREDVVLCQRDEELL